jgi:hypothetical protein
MCSGCSGDYAGGFDSDDPDDPIADAGDRAASASFRGTSDTYLGDTHLGETDWGNAHLGETDLSERDLGETDLAGGADGGPAGLEVREDGLESCEILVTGTHIVEIRVISANSQGKDQSWRMRAALAPDAPSKHSSVASAKYYQTRQGSKETRGYATRCLRISRSFAGACKAKLKGWLRETRRLLRRCTPQSI